MLEMNVMGGENVADAENLVRLSTPAMWGRKEGRARLKFTFHWLSVGCQRFWKLKLNM